MSAPPQATPQGAPQAPPQGQPQGKPKRDDQRDGDLSSFIDEIVKQEVPKELSTCAATASVEILSKAFPQVFSALANFKNKLPEIIALNDEAAKKWKERGNSEYSNGNLDVAGMYYTRAMMHCLSDELLSTLLNNRATVLYSQKRLRDAAVDSNEALRLNPRYVKALERRAVCLTQLGHKELAAKDEEAKKAMAEAGTDEAKQNEAAALAANVAEVVSCLR